jgi:hypothetical protein
MFYSRAGRRGWLDKEGAVDLWYSKVADKSDLIERAVLATSKADEVVFEPIAQDPRLLNICEHTGRIYRGVADIEIIKDMIASWPGEVKHLGD